MSISVQAHESVPRTSSRFPIPHIDVHDDPKAVLSHQRLNHVKPDFSEMHFI